ncbi:MAG TPA: methionine ABC transporter permease, partial [Syntrophomonas sp.]|nr:methionine ABC transporter permease [Syntrophomonas sp.]
MRYQTGVMWITVIVLLILVQLIQVLGTRWSNQVVSKRR